MIEWGVKSLWQNGKDRLCILCRMLPTLDIAPHIILLHFYMACCFYLKSTGPWKINFLYGMSQPTYFYKLHPTNNLEKDMLGTHDGMKNITVVMISLVWGRSLKTLTNLVGCGGVGIVIHVYVTFSLQSIIFHRLPIIGLEVHTWFWIQVVSANLQWLKSFTNK